MYQGRDYLEVDHDEDLCISSNPFSLYPDSLKLYATLYLIYDKTNINSIFYFGKNYYGVETPSSIKSGSSLIALIIYMAPFEYITYVIVST